MTMQIDQRMFAKALKELGHNPLDFHGKKITLDQMAENYEFDRDGLLEAIERKVLSAHYDYKLDTIWIDALEAAHFFYCIKSQELFTQVR
jgi:hypothetical protein